MHDDSGFGLARRLVAVTAVVAFGLAGAGLAQSKCVELAIGDLDGDGFEDAVVADRGLSRDGGCGEVHAIDGRTGARLWRSIGVADSRRVGVADADLELRARAPRRARPLTRTKDFRIDRNRVRAVRSIGS